MRAPRATAATFSRSVRICCRPEVVFAFLADPSTARRIDPAIRSYEPEGGVMGPGVRNHIRLRMAGIPVQSVSETVQWDPPRKMAFRSVRPSRPVLVEAVHTFEPSSNGSTLYTWHMRFVPVGPAGRVVAPVAAWLFRRNADAQQVRLRRELEPPGCDGV